MKKVIKEKLNNILVEHTLSRFPVTLASLFLASLLASIFIDIGSNIRALWFERVEIFLWIFAVGALTTEELINKNSRIKVVLFGIFAIIAGVFVILLTKNVDYVMNVDKNYINLYCIYILVVYVVILQGITLFHFMLRSGKSYSEYVVTAFWGIVRSVILFSITAVGIGVVLGVFNNLIKDTTNFDLIFRVEIFLIGSIFLPSVIRALANNDDGISDFEHRLSERYIVPLYGIALIMSYMAMVYMFIKKRIPAGSVFITMMIIVIIGIMICEVAENASNELKKKLAIFLPLAIIPLIVLQSISVYERIHRFGYTARRYYCIIIIAFELICIVLKLFRKTSIRRMICFVPAILLIITLLIPHINAYSVACRSQSVRLEKYLGKGIDDLNEIELARARSIYQSLRYDTGVEGRKYIKSLKLSKEDEANLNAYWSRNAAMNNVWYYSSYTCYDMEGVGYDRICKIKAKLSHTNIDEDELKELEFSVKKDYAKEDEEMDTFVYDFNNIITSFIIYSSINDDCSKFLQDNNRFELEDGSVIYLSAISIKSTNKGIDYVDIEGYLLTNAYEE